jgi:hypothetical protein
MAGRLPEPAAAHERRLAASCAEPGNAVAGVQRMLMAFRCVVFERDAAESASSRRVIKAAVARRRALPAPYADAALRVVELVARSVHPTP